MRHSIVQTSLDSPAPEQLERAFHVLPDLVGGDADSLARDAYQPVEEVGFLTEAFTPPPAGRLSDPAWPQLATIASSNSEGLLAP